MPVGRRIIRLTAPQYLRTLTQLVGPLPREVRIDTTVAGGHEFSNHSERQDLAAPQVSSLLEVTSQVAQAASSNPGKLAPCLAAAAPGSECVTEFLTSFASGAMRRPASQAEIKMLVAFYDAEAKAETPQVALTQVIRRILLMPDVLFRTELGSAPVGGQVVLTDFERASALSYYLTDGPPDSELMNAAQAGGLRTPEGVRAQAMRLLSSSKTAQGFLSFWEEHLGFESAAEVAKDNKLFPTYQSALAKPMVEETRAFIDHVLWSGDRRFSTLMSAGYSFVNAPLANLYGVKGVTGTALVKADLPAGERAGILTQGSLLASLSADAATNAVHRGAFIRAELLCQPVPPPPPTVDAVPIIPDGVTTERERLGVHRADPACATCHDLIDPVGLAFENYDPIGAFRTLEGKKTIDAGGTVRGVGNTDLTVRNGVDLVQQLARHPVAEACVVKQMLTYALATERSKTPECAVSALAESFRRNNGDMLAAAADIAAAAFLARAAD